MFFTTHHRSSLDRKTLDASTSEELDHWTLLDSPSSPTVSAVSVDEASVDDEASSMRSSFPGSEGWAMPSEPSDEKPESEASEIPGASEHDGAYTVGSCAPYIGAGCRQHRAEKRHYTRSSPPKDPPWLQHDLQLGRAMPVYQTGQPRTRKESVATRSQAAPPSYALGRSPGAWVDLEGDSDPNGETDHEGAVEAVKDQAERVDRPRHPTARPAALWVRMEAERAVEREREMARVRREKAVGSKGRVWRGLWKKRTLRKGGQ